MNVNSNKVKKYEFFASKIKKNMSSLNISLC